ncbi:uncharacterized protein LOC101688436 isoform X3 [Mustela putorius furo]|uniref:Uncharacterized protein LOC101688436 isoform X3 n=1 Tax=Mustela putorius furo TaxID=9669 RepID=M3YCR2_MUSPF|nr:uncharacterized protein LOC101688436 isoform X3 [Mustela putorius furo]
MHAVASAWRPSEGGQSGRLFPSVIAGSSSSELSQREKKPSCRTRSGSIYKLRQANLLPSSHSSQSPDVPPGAQTGPPLGPAQKPPSLGTFPNAAADRRGNAEARRHELERGKTPALLGGDDRALPTLEAMGRAGLAPSAPASFVLAAAVGASAFLPASKPAEPADGSSASGLQPRLLEPHLHVSSPCSYPCARASSRSPPSPRETEITEEDSSRPGLKGRLDLL